MTSTNKISGCELSSNVENTHGLASNSAAPIDAWIVTFKKPLKKYIKKGFLKIHLNSKYLQYIDLSSEELLQLKRKTAGLMYESSVYKKIINPIIDNKVCVNFIRCLGIGNSCSYNDLLNFLIDKTISDDNKLLTVDECKHNLNRSIAFFSNMDPGRPSINDIEPKISDEMSNELYEKFKDFKFNMVINEVAENSITFADYIYERNTKDSNEYWSIIFQLSAACYAMSLNKMNHNDAHAGNIFLQKFDEEQYMLYNINDTPIVIKTIYKVLIYDFDRSYVVSLGKNYLLNDKTCLDTSQCNKFIENKDIIKILCNVYNTSKSMDIRKQILELTSSDADIQYSLSKIYRHMSFDGKIKCFLVNEDEETLSDSVFAKFNSTEQILTNIAKHLPDYSDDIDYVYTYNVSNIRKL